MDPYLKQVLSRAFAVLTFVAGIVAIGSATISVVSMALDLGFIKGLSSFFGTAYKLTWVRIVLFATIEWFTKYLIGFIIAILAGLKGPYRFSKISGIWIMSLFSAGLSTFNIQWLVLGRPQADYEYKVAFVAIVAVLFLVSSGMVYDHYSKYRLSTGQTRPPRRANRRKRTLARRLLPTVPRIGAIHQVVAFQGIAFAVMGFLALKRVL